MKSVSTLMMPAMLLACTAQFALAQEIAAADVVGVTEVQITLNTDDPVRGFSFGLTHDGNVVTLVSIEEGDALLALSEIDYFAVSIDPVGGPGGYVACITSFDDVDEVLPVGDGQVIAVFEYDCEASSTSVLEFSQDLGDPAVENLVVLDGVVAGVVPATTAGSISCAPIFLRGDANGNGDVFPIVDALYLLQYGFTSGPEPDCLDSADCDGNDDVFAIIDALYLLQYGFTDGPTPPAPGPDSCGPDVGESVGCVTPPDSCP